MAADTLGGREFVREVTGDVVAHTDDKLAAALLWNTQLPRFLDLRLHSVAKRARLGLNTSKEPTLRRALKAEHVLHHEHTRPENSDVFEEDAVKIPALVPANTRAMIAPITLPNGAVALAGRPSDDDIHRVHSELGSELIGREPCQIFAQSQCLLREVCFEGADSLFIEVNRGQHTIARAQHSKAETTATTEQVEASELIGNWLRCHFSQLILISFSSALNSGSPVTSSAFFSFANAAAKASAKLIL